MKGYLPKLRWLTVTEILGDKCSYDKFQAIVVQRRYCRKRNIFTKRFGSLQSNNKIILNNKKKYVTQLIHWNPSHSDLYGDGEVKSFLPFWNMWKRTILTGDSWRTQVTVLEYFQARVPRCTPLDSNKQHKSKWKQHPHTPVLPSLLLLPPPSSPPIMSKQTFRLQLWFYQGSRDPETLFSSGFLFLTEL